LVTAKPVETQGGALIGLAQKSTSATPSPAIAGLLEQEQLHQAGDHEKNLFSSIITLFIHWIWTGNFWINQG
jgi:hypothetical protein